jgi:hypothetical protein
MLRLPTRRTPWLTARGTIFQHADFLEVDFFLWERLSSRDRNGG